MSRTHKTNPLRVRMARGEVNSAAYHDHDAGEPCDLPAKPPASWNAAREQTRCHWMFDSDGRGVCGCRMCTMYDLRREDRRRERRQGKTEAEAGRW